MFQTESMQMTQSSNLGMQDNKFRNANLGMQVAQLSSKFLSVMTDWDTPDSPSCRLCVGRVKLSEAP